jgi:hypothetical protein
MGGTERGRAKLDAHAESIVPEPVVRSAASPTLYRFARQRAMVWCDIGVPHYSYS